MLTQCQGLMCGRRFKHFKSTQVRSKSYHCFILIFELLALFILALLAAEEGLSLFTFLFLISLVDLVGSTITTNPTSLAIAIAFMSLLWFRSASDHVSFQ